MPFRTRIHPIHVNGVREGQEAAAPVMKQTPRSRMKRLFERPFSLKNLAGLESHSSRSSEEYDPSSFSLRRMVERYIEDPDEKQPRSSYFNCFSGSSGTDSSSDENEEEESSPGGVLRILKNLLLCTNFYESDLETKATKIVEEDDEGNKTDKNSQLRNLADELVALGYDATICTALRDKSKWSSVPAGDYEYLDVMIGGNRVLIELGFQSKFEIARPTETYKTILQTLPNVFVGQVDRLKKIVVFVSKAANKSYKKSGLSMPPWRKDKFLFTKWTTHYDRAKRTPAPKKPFQKTGPWN